MSKYYELSEDTIKSFVDMAAASAARIPLMQNIQSEQERISALSREKANLSSGNLPESGMEALDALKSLEASFSQKAFEKYPEFNLIGRLLTEKYYIELEERTISLQFQTATERYLKLLQQQPQLLQKASLGMIASYLGISQETLSRIRKKI